MSSKLSELGLPTAIAHDSERYIHVLRTMAPDDPRLSATLDAYLHGFQGVWILMTAICGSALLTSLFIKKFDMNKELVTKFTARDSGRV